MAILWPFFAKLRFRQSFWVLQLVKILIESKNTTQNANIIGEKHLIFEWFSKVEKFKEDFQGDLKKMNDRQPLDDRNEFKQVYRKNWASKKEFK